MKATRLMVLRDVERHRSLLGRRWGRLVLLLRDQRVWHRCVDISFALDAALLPRVLLEHVLVERCLDNILRKSAAQKVLPRTFLVCLEHEEGRFLLQFEIRVRHYTA